MQRIAYLVAGLIIGISVAAHGASASVPRAACTPTNQTLVPTGKGIIMHGTGSLWQVWLTRVVVTDKLNAFGTTIHAQGKYVIVFLKARNLSKHPAGFGADLTVQLADDQGRTFVPPTAGNPALLATEQFRISGDIAQPTFVEPYLYVFDVARDAHGLRLQSTDVEGNQPRTLFRLGV